jgi:hypothetical protein
MVTSRSLNGKENIYDSLKLGWGVAAAPWILDRVERKTYTYIEMVNLAELRLAEIVNF